MLITKTSSLTGKSNSLDIPLTQEEFNTAWQKYQTGTFIQDAFAMLSDDHREFLITGITPDEWNNLIGPDPQDELDAEQMY